MSSESHTGQGHKETPDVPQVRPWVERGHVAEIRRQGNATGGVSRWEGVAVDARHAQRDAADIEVWAWAFEDEFHGGYDNDIHHQHSQHVEAVGKPHLLATGQVKQEKEASYGKPGHTVTRDLEYLAEVSDDASGSGLWECVEPNGACDQVIQSYQLGK